MESSGDAGSKYLYKIPGMHEEDGILYLASTPREHLERIQQFSLSSEDLIIATFSKSGTTWTQEVAYLINNGVDTEEAKSRPITKRVPFIDYNAMWPAVTSLKSPRIIKTHLQPHYFQEQIENSKTKVVVMMRNPKDTLVSFYHFYKINRAFGCFNGTWDDFFKIICEKQLIYGDWFQYTKSWWDLRDRDNVLLLKYEDMKQEPARNVRKLAQFMGKELSDEQIDKIVQATSFDKMRENPSVSYSGSDFLTKGSTFMRKGSTGDWKNTFSVAQNDYFDAWYRREMEGTVLDFTFEL